MSIASRARAAAEMPEHEQPLSEQYRIAAKEYVKAKSISKLSEDLKPSRFAELMKQRSDIAVSRAEIDVRASNEWKEHVASVVAAAEAADMARHKVKWIEMRFQEWVMEQAGARKEREMGRQSP
jgi:hypothetical protein